MSRLWFDKFSGTYRRVPSRADLEAEKNQRALEEMGVDTHNIHCACCGLALTDSRKLKVSSEGAIGPECSKPGHVFPCRHGAN